MSLYNRVIALAGVIGGDVRSILAKQGDLSTLNTTVKSDLVSAINEVLLSASKSEIDDLSKGTDATWSASKIGTELGLAIAAAKTELLGGIPPETLNTLTELATALGNNESFANEVLATLSNSVSFTVDQVRTEEEKGRARNNIGAVGVDDFTATVNTFYGQIDGLQSQVTGLASTVDGLTAGSTALAASVAANTNDISALGSRVTDVTASVTDLAATTAANAAAAAAATAAVANDVSTLGAQVSTNTDDIAALTSVVSSNAATAAAASAAASAAAASVASDLAALSESTSTQVSAASAAAAASLAAAVTDIKNNDIGSDVDLVAIYQSAKAGTL